MLLAGGHEDAVPVRVRRVELELGDPLFIEVIEGAQPPFFVEAAALGEEILRIFPVLAAMGRDHVAVAGGEPALGLKLDVLYGLYEERMAQFEESPPGDDWGGVFVAMTK